MKKILTLASILGIATLANSIFSVPAKAIDADVTINVDVPEIVYLQTYDSITYKIDSTDLFSEATNPEKNGGVIVKKDGSFDATNTGEVLGTPDFTADDAKVTTSDFLAYRVWGIGGTNGTLKADTSYNGTELKKDTSVIGITLKSATSTGEVAAKGLDPATPTIEGKVSFEFDFKGVTQAGLHEPKDGGVLKITASAL